MTQIELDFGRDADAAARIAIVEELDATLFVEAGAGSGKTRSLVERVAALVRSGVPLREIAAVTFTEKAAGELRDRIRRRIELAAADAAAAGDEAAARLARDALDELDTAAVSTLHAFAQRLLAEHPVEAGLPPRVEVLDEIASQIAFDERWARFVDRLLEDPVVERTLLLGLHAGINLDKLRDLAVACNANWDLVATRMGPEPDPPPLDLSAGLDELRSLATLAASCVDPEDLMSCQLCRLAEWIERMERAPDEFERLRLAVELAEGFPKLRLSVGRKANWDPAGIAVKDVQRRLGAASDALKSETQRVAEAVVRRLAWELAGFTLEEAGQRRRAGTLEFHDLLVLARGMLRDPVHGADVRSYVRGRITHLMLDEFQDTDPIQWDIAALIASGRHDAGTLPWDAIVVDPGRLFVVGDPKQSIYRFRRADIAAFLRARGAFGAAPMDLTRNFRTVAPVIEFVNHVFSDLITATPDMQPAYVALQPMRDAPAGAVGPPGPPVVLLGTRLHEPRLAADALRAREAADVVGAIRAALAEGWLVARDAPAGGDPVWEPCRLGDICVLLPARTSLGHLEDALAAAGIPARAETSSLVYGTREIRDLLLTLRAVDDPTDELALVSALRSPVFGCGDDDLYTFRVGHGGRWDHQAAPPESLPADHPVGAAMRTLAEWHDARQWVAPSELLDRVVRERRVLETGFARARPRDLWRRVRFVVDQARAFSESTGGSLRDFLRWAELQSDEGTRVVETVLPETDDDAVRILTIHGSKGLEFPITIVSGMTTRAVRRRPGVQLVFPHDSDTYALKVSARVMTEEFERYRPIDEQMDFHEKLRLLYVAATRARDHLIVSVHRAERPLPDDRSGWSLAELVAAAAEGAPHAIPFATGTPDVAPILFASADATVPPLPSWEAWSSRRAELLAASARPRAVAATAISEAARALTSDPGLAKEPRDLELPAWNKGRYGTAVGRAVHAVLQTVDLATGDGVDDAAAAQAVAEGVTGFEDRIAALARAALDTRAVRAAVATGYRRELYVAAPAVPGKGDGLLLEGYIDLLYRSDDGIVVVDYKTDAWEDATHLDAKLAGYRLQAGAYALALERATGERVARCTFLFLSPDRAVERDVVDLPDAIADVRRVLAEMSAAR